MGSAIRLPIVSNFEHFAITFPGDDRIKLVLAPADVVDITSEILKEFCGIKKIVKMYRGIVEYYLKKPAKNFPKSLKIEDLRIKQALCLLMKEYSALGWHLKVSMMLTEYGNDTSRIIFERGEPLKTQIICLSLHDTDEIRILGPDSVSKLVDDTVKTAWPFGIIASRKILVEGYEIKVKKDPFYEGDKDTTKFTLFMMNSILSCLHEAGWMFTGAIRTEFKNDNLNALYFKYDPDERLKYDSRLFAMSLHDENEIHFINASINLVMALRVELPKLWKAGVEKENFVNNNLYVLKLKGSPWHSIRIEEIESKRLIGNIFSLLRRFNWDVYAVCDLTKHLIKKSTFFFRYSQIVTNVEKPQTVCISLDGKDKIRTIDAGKSIDRLVRDSIDSAWPLALKKQRAYYNDTWQFNLHGYPFYENEKQNIYALVIMMFILKELQYYGLKFICSADVSGRYNIEPDYGKDLHSWYFASHEIQDKIGPVGNLKRKLALLKDPKALFRTFFTKAKEQIIAFGKSILSSFTSMVPKSAVTSNLKNRD